MHGSAHLVMNRAVLTTHHCCRRVASETCRHNMLFSNFQTWVFLFFKKKTTRGDDNFFYMFYYVFFLYTPFAVAAVSSPRHDYRCAFYNECFAATLTASSENSLRSMSPLPSASASPQNSFQWKSFPNNDVFSSGCSLK